MDKNSKTEVELKESIQVYPTIKPIIEEAESKKYLYFFCKKTETKNKQEKLDNKKISKEKEQNHLDKEEEYYLINKGLEQEKTKSKRTNDIKSALENFLKNSDLIEKISKLLEEKEKLIYKEKIEKIKYKKGNNNEIEEEKEKLTDIYINSVISKLAEKVGIKVYKKNEFIMKMNETGENCYFLLSGSLSVLKPVEYHLEMTYDEYMQYLANLLKYKEFEIINDIRIINQYYIDIGIVEELNQFIKTYFIIKFKNDILRLMKNDKFEKGFIQNRFKLFHLSFEDYDLNSVYIIRHIEEIMKGSSLREKDLREYLDLILPPEKINQEILYSNPHIFDNDKHKFTIFKYENFLHLKPGAFFGETALDNNIHKRNASIRAQEDCVILSLDNDYYQVLLYEYNRKLKLFDVVFICRNFFFNNISTTIFTKNYFSHFKFLIKNKDDIIYKQSLKVTSVYFVKEGNLKLEIKASIIEINNLIKFFYDKLSTNPNIKISQAEMKEIKENYIDDKTIPEKRHQSLIMREKLNMKIKFELFTSSYCDTLGLEEYFLKNNYLCTCTVISKEAKIFEINSDSLNNIITNEKICHNSYYNLIGNKLVTSIKRLHMIKINYVNQLKYKIKENFFGTEILQDKLIKGQTGLRRPFCKYIKKNSDPKTINYYYKNPENEEIKNKNFKSLQKATSKLNMARNINYPNSQWNMTKGKSLDNSSFEESKNKKKKKINFDLYDFINTSYTDNKTNTNYFFSKEKLKEKETNNKINKGKRIMETTIIKVGKDSLTLREIDNRIKSTETPQNQDLSIVKNFFRSTTSFNHIQSMNFKDKCNNYANILSLKNNIKLFNQKDKLPGLSNNRYGKYHPISKTKYKQRSKNKKIILKPLIISCQTKNYNNYLKNLAEEGKNSFNVILADQDDLISK